MRIRFALTALTVAALLGTSVFWNHLPAVGQVTRPFPVATSCTVAAGTSAQCIGLNPSRRSIEICNVGVNATAVWISPNATSTSNASPAVVNGGTSYPLAGIASNVPTCYRTPTGSVGSGGSAWNAIAVTSAGVLMIYEY